MQNTGRHSYESEGFRAHDYLTRGDEGRWKYKASKLTSVLAEEDVKWKTARTTVTVRTITISVAPKQLTFDFSPRVEEEGGERPLTLARLEEAANKGNDRAFVSILSEVQWQNWPSSDFVRVLKLSLKAGAHKAAQYIATEGVKHHPDSVELQRYAHLFAPPRIIARNLPPEPTLAANREWLKNHRHEYSGLWVAIRNGELLGTASSLEELVSQVGSTENVLLTKA